MTGNLAGYRGTYLLRNTISYIESFYILGGFLFEAPERGPSPAPLPRKRDLHVLRIYLSYSTGILSSDASRRTNCFHGFHRYSIGHSKRKQSSQSFMRSEIYRDVAHGAQWFRSPDRSDMCISKNGLRRLPGLGCQSLDLGEPLPGANPPLENGRPTGTQGGDGARLFGSSGLSLASCEKGRLASETLRPQLLLLSFLGQECTAHSVNHSSNLQGPSRETGRRARGQRALAAWQGSFGGPAVE